MQRACLLMTPAVFEDATSVPVCVWMLVFPAPSVSLMLNSHEVWLSGDEETKSIHLNG